MALVHLTRDPDLENWSAIARKHDIVVVGIRGGRVHVQTWIGNKLMKQEEYSLRETAILASLLATAIERELSKLEQDSAEVTLELTRG